MVSRNMPKKYCLVRFVDDSILYVMSTNKITSIEDKLVWAPYKGMGYYEATSMEYNDSRTLLENKKKEQANKKFGTIPELALVDVLAQKSYRDDDMQSVIENNNSLDIRQTATEIKRTRWTSPEKKEAFRIFGKELTTNKLPSTAFCQEILEHNSVFHKRTPEMLRAFINMTNKKKKNTG